MEVMGAYTLEVFAYRSEVSGLFMALVTRAAITASLQDYGVAELADWDESDAFFRNQRDQVSALSRVFPGVWDRGEWCQQYFDRLEIHPLISDGFAPPFVTGEGFNQGDDYSGDGYQLGCAVVNASSPVPTEICKPPSTAGLLSPMGPRVPAHVTSFSDDRGFITTTKGALMHASLNVSGLPSPNGASSTTARWTSSCLCCGKVSRACT